jgi:glycosyltransferase involved in cell wall biosynthesis
MRLLFFNRSFHPDVEATGQLLTELCQDLAAGGYAVTVVAGRPYNMARFGSWWPVQREQFGAVTILRAFNPRLNKRHFLLRILNLFSYFCFSFIAGCFAHRPDVVVVETDPPVLGLVALFFARLYRAKFVFYLQDLYPDIGVALGQLRLPLLIKTLDFITRLTLLHADRVVVLGEDMKRRLAMKGYQCWDRVVVVPNWVDTRVIQTLAGPNRFRQQHQLDGRFVVMFSGNLGLSQSLDTVLEAAAGLRDEERVRFVFIGEGAAKAGLVEKAKREGLSNVQFHPYQPKEQLSESLGAADVHLVTLRRGLGGLIVPSKVYGIMAAGRAFIAAVEDDSHVAEIVRTHHCGRLIPPDDSVQLRQAITWALEQPAALREMGQRGRAAAEQDFDRPVAVAQFRGILVDLTTSPKSSL